jgi:hypothetical protein
MPDFGFRNLDAGALGGIDARAHPRLPKPLSPNLAGELMNPESGLTC